MSVSEKLQFVITANASDAVKAFQDTGKAADKELGKAQARIDKLGSGLTKFGAGAMAAAGIAGVGLYKLGQSASNLEESINAVNVTFGDASAGILDLSKDAAKAVGMSEVAFNGLAVQFSSFAETVAGDGGDVVQVMADITGRAADFASVMNLDVAEASRVFQSGLAGETEPLKKFGIDLSAAAVEAYAAANGIGEVGRQLTESEKVQARYGALMEQTSKTQGDFANTAEGAANQQRVLKAELENLSASIGAGVLPVMTSVITVIGDLVSSFDSLPDPVKKSIGGIATFGTIALGAAGAISFVSGQVIKARDSFSKLGASAVKAGPLVAVAAVAVVGFGLQARKTAKDNEALAASIAEVSRVSDAELMSKFVEVLRDGMIAGKDSAETFREMARTNMDGAIRVREYVSALEANGTATKDQIAFNNQLRDAIKDEESARRQATKTAEDAAAAEEKLAASTRDVGDKAANAAPKVGDMAAANAAVADHAAAAEEATREFYDTLVAFADGSLSYVEAVDRAEDAVADFDKVLGDADSSLEEIDDSARNAAGALIETAKAGVELDGASLDTKAGVDALKESLFLQAMSMAPDSPLRKYLVDYIADLNSTPTSITTTLTLIERRVGAGAGADQGDGGWRAAGGPVLPGNTYRVGEQGPESLTMSGTGAGVVAPSSAPAPTLDPAAFGREAAVEFARVLRQQMRAA